MAPKSFLLSNDLHRYLLGHSSGLDDVRRRLAAENEGLGAVARMQIAPEQALLLTMLTTLIGARRAVEVGTFTGMSSLSIALGLPADGHLVCCDVSEEWTAVARRYWVEAGVADRIDLRIGPAERTLGSLPGGADFDLAFIDADKPGYIGYWDQLVPRVRIGGVLLVDNVLQEGRVVEPEASGESLEAILAFNDHVSADTRVDVVILPVADGLTMARRRS